MTEATQPTQPQPNASLNPRWQPVMVVCALIVITLTVVLLFAEFFAPYSFDETSIRSTYMPPQRLHFLDPTPTGKRLRLHVYGYQRQRDPQTLGLTYKRDLNQKIYVGFLVRGEPYSLLFNTIKSERHLFGPVEPGDSVHLLGTDRLGRDVLSRLLVGVRRSLGTWIFTMLFSTAIALLFASLLQRYQLGESRFTRRLGSLIQSVPTWVFRLLLLGLMIWHWPLLKIFVQVFIRQGRFPPVIVPALLPALLSLLALCFLTLLIHRRLLRWLTVMWATMAIWQWGTLSDLIYRSSGSDGTLINMMGNIFLFERFGTVLLLMVAILPGLLLVTSGIVVVQQKATSATNGPNTRSHLLPNTWRATALGITFFAVAMIPMLYPAEIAFSFGELGDLRRLPSLGSFYGDYSELSNLQVWAEAPWLFFYLIPVLVILLSITPLADRLLQRSAVPSASNAQPSTMR